MTFKSGRLGNRGICQRNVWPEAVEVRDYYLHLDRSRDTRRRFGVIEVRKAEGFRDFK